MPFKTAKNIAAVEFNEVHLSIRLICMSHSRFGPTFAVIIRVHSAIEALLLDINWLSRVEVSDLKTTRVLPLQRLQRHRQAG